MRSIDFSEETLSQYDCALISTDHDNVDYALLAKHVSVVVDTRNATKDLSADLLARVVKA